MTDNLQRTQENDENDKCTARKGGHTKENMAQSSRRVKGKFYQYHASSPAKCRIGSIPYPDAPDSFMPAFVLCVFPSDAS